MLNKLRTDLKTNIISKIINVIFVIGLALIVWGALFEDNTNKNIGLMISMITLLPVLASVIFKLGFFNHQGNNNVVKNSHQNNLRSSNKKDGKFVYHTDNDSDFICYSRYYAETGERIEMLFRQEIPKNFTALRPSEFVRIMFDKFKEHLRHIKTSVSDAEIRRMLIFYYRCKHLNILIDGQFLRKSDNIILLDEIYNDGNSPEDTIARIELEYTNETVNLNCIVIVPDSRGSNAISKTIATDTDLIFMPTIDIFAKYREEIMPFFATYIKDFAYEDTDELDSNGMKLFSDDTEFFEFADGLWKPLFQTETIVNKEKFETEEYEVIINILTGQLMYHSARTFPYFSTFKTNHQTQIITYDQLKEKILLAHNEIAKDFEEMTEKNWTKFV